MARDFSRKFYNSKEWKKCREAFKQSTIDQLCNRCDEPGDEVHHIIYLTPENINDPYITLGWDNLELLCQSCHSKEHMIKYDVVRDDVMFDEKGDLIANGKR